MVRDLTQQREERERIEEGLCHTFFNAILLGAFVVWVLVLLGDALGAFVVMVLQGRALGGPRTV